MGGCFSKSQQQPLGRKARNKGAPAAEGASPPFKHAFITGKQIRPFTLNMNHALPPLPALLPLLPFQLPSSFRSV
jgi:hypothetical protein